MPIVIRPDGSHEMRVLPPMGPMGLLLPVRAECARQFCDWSDTAWGSYFKLTPYDVVVAGGAALAAAAAVEWTLRPGAHCPVCGSLVLALRFGG